MVLDGSTYALVLSAEVTAWPNSFLVVPIKSPARSGAGLFIFADTIAVLCEGYKSILDIVICINDFTECHACHLRLGFNPGE